ncbi:aspartate 1-decarboxylase [Fimbriiglobus ruber]|uniref:Aspartate 1-decarboxylase n=1 Tax=Fimbriiglobus ruber TaxID=1908690 RepID=A0A225E4I2_9BACT|nr:aspartate 1-decarboxylase [Fimbriiglobus ruber]OWK44986.1 Aspartate 1-decarboxylase [Fimbriiglobus ruber]
MRRTVLKSKIHRATVTATNLDYEGSLTVDADLLDAADILPNEQIHVWDVTNGTRLITYALPGDRASGVVQVNGAGAHLIKTGDIIIIATFTTLRTKDAKKHQPLVLFADELNRSRDAEQVIAAADGDGPHPGEPADAPAANGVTGKSRKRGKGPKSQA